MEQQREEELWFATQMASRAQSVLTRSWSMDDGGDSGSERRRCASTQLWRSDCQFRHRRRRRQSGVVKLRGYKFRSGEVPLLLLLHSLLVWTWKRSSKWFSRFSNLPTIFTARRNILLSLSLKLKGLINCRPGCKVVADFSLKWISLYGSRAAVAAATAAAVEIQSVYSTVLGLLLLSYAKGFLFSRPRWGETLLQPDFFFLRRFLCLAAKLKEVSPSNLKLLLLRNSSAACFELCHGVAAV